VTSWLWTIDGDVFSDAHPATHVTVDSAGEYEICLIIETTAGCIDTFCKTVHVEEEQGDCHAEFTYTVDGNTINLDGSSSSDNITSWQWTLNGDIFSDSHPTTHVTVDSAGEYVVCLIIETASGCTDTFCNVIHVENESGGCDANFTYEVDGE